VPDAATPYPQGSRWRSNSFRAGKIAHRSPTWALTYVAAMLPTMFAKPAISGAYDPAAPLLRPQRLTDRWCILRIYEAPELPVLCRFPVLQIIQKWLRRSGFCAMLVACFTSLRMSAILPMRFT
jgi:hypothetical protein